MPGMWLIEHWYVDKIYLEDFLLAVCILFAIS